MKSCERIVFVGLLFFNFCLDASPITRVMKHNLGAYNWEDEDWPNEPYHDYLMRCMKYQENLQPFKKNKAAWTILDRYYERAPQYDNHVIGNDVLTWQNLQLMRGEKEEERNCYVAHIVDHTSTEIGRVKLRALIAQPTDNRDELLRRQRIVKYLVAQQELFAELDKQLINFKKSEDFLLSFWLNDPLKQSAQKNYFSFGGNKAIEQRFNTQARLLQVGAAWDHHKRIVAFLMTGFATAILPLYGISKLVPESAKSQLLSSDGSKQFNKISQRLIASGGPIFGLLSFSENQYVEAAGFILAGVVCGMHAREQYEWTRDNFTLNKCLQKKLHHVGNCVKALEAIGNALSAHTELQFDADKNLSKLIQEFKVKQDKLYKLLQSSTFAGQASIFSHWGEILVAYKLLHENTASFEPLLCAVADIDAYMSVGRLYKEFESSRVKYCFVDYAQASDKPMVKVQELWSPFIDPASVVPNSIELGSDNNARNLIITGPNEGGKSTFVKAIAIGLILAQSIGIMPAREAVITPFSYIATYLNITDDHGKSLFEAQVQRAKQILDHIDGMEKNKFSFAIIDELFNGTDARVGQATSFSIADYLSKKENVISIFPTHFPELTNLEQNGHSINYRVSATINDAGKITYPFRLEKGASNQNIVLNIMRNEGFNPEIIKRAAELIKPTV